MSDLETGELLSSAENYLREKLAPTQPEKLSGLLNDLERQIFRRLVIKLVRERVNAAATVFLAHDKVGGKPTVGVTWQPEGKAQLTVFASDAKPFVALRDLYATLDRLLPPKGEPPCAPSPQSIQPSTPLPTSAAKPKAVKARSSASGKTAKKPGASGSRKAPSTPIRKSSTRKKTRVGNS